MAALETFFAAWSDTDPATRTAKIAEAMGAEATYSDPRTGDRLVGIEAIADYVGMFSANAPGWTAEVVASDEVNGYVRARVKFAGTGPDGQEMAQHGTYFADFADGKITSLAGFVGDAPAG